MSEEIRIETIESQPVMAVTEKGAVEDIGTLMGNALKQVDEYLTNQNEEAVGPPFARYLKVDGNQMTFEAGYPVKELLIGTEKVRPGDLPVGEVASVIHEGSYDSLDQTHEILRHWIAGQEKVPAGAPWEVYLTDPNEEEDVSKWQTLVRWPVKAKVAGDDAAS